MRNLRARFSSSLTISIALLAVAVLTVSGANGTLDTAFSANLGSGFSSGVAAFTFQADGRILAATGSSFVNGVPTRSLVRLNTDGSVDTAFTANMAALFPHDNSFQGSGEAVAVQVDGTILLGGLFDLSGLPHSFLARVKSDGTPDSAFSAALDASGVLNRAVNAIGLQSDGKIVISEARSPGYLVRLNADGSEDTAFTATIGTGFNGSPRGLAIQSDGKIVVAGDFNLFNGAFTNGLARLNTDGSFDTAFAAHVGNGLFDSPTGGSGVTSMALQPDGRIIVGGNFTQAGLSSPSRCVARFGTDGTVDAAFGANLGEGCAGGQVFAIATQAGGIMVAGDFTSMNGLATPNLARLNANGSVDAIFANNLGAGFTQTGFGTATTYVGAVALQPDGKVLASGLFTAVDGIASNFVARFGAAPTLKTDQAALNFGAATNGAAFTSQTAAQTIRLTQTGDGTVSWSAQSSQPWLVVTPSSGTGTATVNASVKFVSGLTSTQTATITLTLGGAANAIAPIPVRLNTVSSTGTIPPFGSFDTPIDGTTGVAGSIAVTGWALDDVQVTGVTICRDPATGEIAPLDARCDGMPKIFIGNATFIDGARPDVQAAFPTAPLPSRGGWGYLILTNFLPNLGNGTFTLYAYASDADGHTAPLGAKTIVCNNAASTAPFGAIDTPGQGDTVSGVVANFGWVLSPGTLRADPPGGGTVNVFVDGAVVGSPGGWTARPDLSALFPQSQFAGIGTALGVFGLDTTQFANGVHTLSWIVTATSGGTSGIGSRFFTISNGTLSSLRSSAGPASARVADLNVDALALDGSPVEGRVGFDLREPTEMYPFDGQRVFVRVHELDRIELRFEPHGNRVSAFLRAPDGLRPLPTGSHLDPTTGVFTWTPAAGYLGVYDLVLVRGGTGASRQEIRILIGPQG